MEDIRSLRDKQKAFFNTGQTKDPAFRISQLKRLRKALVAYEDRIIDALMKDFRKPPFETITTEIGVTVEEIDYIVKHLKKWTKPKKVPTPILHMFSKSRLYPEPYGVSLVVGTWNYPVQLVIAPVVGSMAGGNCTIIKPSFSAGATADVLYDMITEYFSPEYLAVVKKTPGVYDQVLSEQFDYIFFTGSIGVGKSIMEAASKHLTPVTLELGGKSPCVVDENVHMKTTARRILWGKFLNAGQTCIAPDYLVVHKNIKDEFLTVLGDELKAFYGSDPSKSEDYCRIVNQRQFDKLVEMLGDPENVAIGGEYHRETLYFAPTVLHNVNWEHPSMKDEIFGPILPVLTYETLDEAIDMVKNYTRPLALYVFTRNKKTWKRIINETSFGGGCVNETLSHIVSPHLPFGGVGHSGMGRYHGKSSFDTFTNYKSVLKKPWFPDLFLRYPPYKKYRFGLLKKYFRI